MPSKWSTRHAIHSCNCHWQLTITSSPAFLSGSNFDPDMLFRFLSWWYSELNSNKHITPSVVMCAFFCSCGYFPITIAGMYCMSERTFKRRKLNDVKGKIFRDIYCSNLVIFVCFYMGPSSSKQRYENC